MLNLINKFSQKDGVCAVWIIFLKTVRNRHIRLTAGSSTPRTSHAAENTDTVNDLAFSQEGEPGTHKTARQIARETGILQRSVGGIVHKDI